VSQIPDDRPPEIPVFGSQNWDRAVRVLAQVHGFVARVNRTALNEYHKRAESTQWIPILAFPTAHAGTHEIAVWFVARSKRPGGELSNPIFQKKYKRNSNMHLM
jgi:hypothetical protein